MADRDDVRTFAGALYPLGVLLTVLPLVDMSMRAYPFRPGAPEWRFAALGTLFGNIGTILIGTAVVGAVAAYRNNGVLLRILSVIATLAGVALGVLLALFALDVVQVRQTAPEALKRAIFSSAVSATTAGALGAIALLSIGIGAWRASRRGPRAARAAAPNPMVVQSAMTGTKTK